MKKIYVLHERSTKEHFIALEEFSSRKGLIVEYREFLIFRYFIKSILRVDLKLFFQQIKNILFFFHLIFSSKKKIIIGIAPLDFHLIFIRQFLKKHHVFYMTSWSDWSGDFLPKKKFKDYLVIKKQWSNFLEGDIRGLFSVTTAAANSIKKYYKINCPISIVNHSLDNTIKVDELLLNNRKREKISLIYVGRLVESKGIKELIKLIKELDKEKYLLKIVGDGSLRSFVEEASRSYSNIEYIGYINSKKDLFDLYTKSDVQLLFSKKDYVNNWEELFGMVIIEAMYCGLPTISTNHVGPKSIIEDGIDGFLIREGNIINDTKKILREEIFKNKQIASNAKKKAAYYYKNNLEEKWEEILKLYI